MYTYNLKRAIKVKLLDDGLASSEPRYVTAKALRVRVEEALDKFVRLEVLDAIDNEGRIWHAGFYADGFDRNTRPIDKSWDEWTAYGIGTRLPSIVQVAADNIESYSDEVSHG